MINNETLIIIWISITIWISISWILALRQSVLSPDDTLNPSISRDEFIKCFLWPITLCYLIIKYLITKILHEMKMNYLFVSGRW